MTELTMSDVEQVSGGRGRRRSGNRPSAGFQNSSISRAVFAGSAAVASKMGPIGLGMSVALAALSTL